MMDREWQAILNRYGQLVQVCLHPQAQQQMVRAFVQNILDKDTQLAPSPMGLRREERALYLGPARLKLLPRASVIVWNGREYEVTSTRSVGDGHHVWAILQGKEASS